MRVKKLFTMRKALLFTLTACLITISGIFSQTVYKNSIDGQIFFKINDDEPLTIAVDKDSRVANLDDATFLNDIIRKYQITALRSPFDFQQDSKLLRIYKLEFSDIQDVDKIVNDLKKLKNIEFAERVPLYRAILTPNDPLYTSTSYGYNWNWHWDKINATGAWGLCTGSATVKVAVVDNAVWVSHPDLAGKIVAQYDAADGDNDPSPPSGGTQETQYYWSHGTHCAGLVGASTNNGVGVAGIGYNVGIIAIKTTKNTENPMYMTAIDVGLNWAANHGANVISMSFGGPDASGISTAYNQLLATFYNAGIVLVAAAGNNGDGGEDATNPNYICYPAACTNVVAVGATSADDKRAGFSEYGTWLDVSAPGGYSPTEASTSKISLLSTTFCNSYIAGSIPGITGTKYDLMQGTSMACPIVAGLCGLMKSYAPSATAAQIVNCLKSSAFNIDALNPGFAGQLGTGRVDALAALQCINTYNGLTADFSASANNITAGAYIAFTDHSTGSPTGWAWTFTGGTPSTFSGQNPPAIRYLNAGDYQVQLIVTKAGLTNTMTKPAYIHVTGVNGISGNVPPQYNDISIYPNPAKDFINIHFPTEIQGKAIVNVYNAIGKLIKQTVDQIVNNTMSLDLGNLESGLYFICIENDGIKTTRKISLTN